MDVTQVEISKEPVVRMLGIRKVFGGVVALRNVDFYVYDGEVVGLVGDNGAGKSTLIKILSGVYMPDSGEIYVKGKKVRFRSPIDAWNHGIAAVYQELALADKMDAIENIFLGHELRKTFLGIPVLDKSGMRRRATELLKQLGVTLKSFYVPTGRLSGGERQAIAIARALNLEAKVFIMDEPTAALAVGESEKVLNFALNLKKRGKSVIIISHNLEHIFRIVDRIVVLRHGEVVGDVLAGQVDKDTIVKLITGTLARLENGGVKQPTT